MVGTGIESIRRQRERLRMQNMGKIKRPDLMVSSSPSTQNLSQIVGGTLTPLFQPGVNNPDDPVEGQYYVP